MRAPLFLPHVSMNVNHFACVQNASQLFSANRTGNPKGPTCQRRFRWPLTGSSPPVDSPAAGTAYPAPRCPALRRARSPASSCAPTPRSCRRRRGRSPASPRRASLPSAPEQPPRRRPPRRAFASSRASAPVRRVRKAVRNYRLLSRTSTARRNVPCCSFALLLFSALLLWRGACVSRRRGC